jgi:hypothetical protein
MRFKAGTTHRYIVADGFVLEQSVGCDLLGCKCEKYKQSELKQNMPPTNAPPCTSWGSGSSIILYLITFRVVPAVAGFGAHRRGY